MAVPVVPGMKAVGLPLAGNATDRSAWPSRSRETLLDWSAESGSFNPVGTLTLAELLIETSCRSLANDAVIW